MGYRSDVAYIIKFKSDDDRSKYIEHLRSMKDSKIESALNEVALSISEPTITFSAESVKWYDAFDDVKAHRTIYRESEHFGGIYRCIEVGEDGMTNCDALDDYELEDYVYSVHRLEVNF
jgi:hypothetical protein